MKKLSSTLFIFLCCYVTIFAQKTDTVNTKKTTDYFLHFEQQINPSIILLPFFIEQKGEKTKINSFFKLSEGDYFSPFGLSKGKGLFFDVLTLQKVHKWYLKGAFEYNNSFFAKSHILLSDYGSLINSPLFLFQQKSGVFNIQNYHFKTMVARAFFDEKINLGLRFNYSGRSLYRRSDIRNNQQSLNLNSALGIGYNLNKNTILGIDFGLDYSKTSPNLSKKYNHPVDDTLYRHYMNIGFGTIDYAAVYKYKIIRLIPSLTFTLSQKTDKGEKTIRLSAKNEKNEWTDLNIKKTSLDDKPFLYKALIFESDLFFKFIAHKRIFISKMRAMYKRGNTWRKVSNQGVYSPAVVQEYLNINVGLAYFLGASFVRKIGIDFSTFAHQMKDLNYVSSMQLSEFKIMSDISFSYSATEKLSFGLDLGGTFSANLTNQSNKGVLDNTAFYHSVYLPYMDYYGNSHYGWSSKWYLRYKKQLISTLFIETNYQEPLRKSKTKDYFYTLKFGVTILI